MTMAANRILGNGVEMSMGERSEILGIVLDKKGNIDLVGAVKEIVEWFDKSSAPIVFQATAVVKGVQQGYWRYWNGRFWSVYSEVTLMSDIDWIMGGNLLTSRIASIVSTMRTRLAVPHELFDTRPIVVFRDRVLQVEGDKITTYKPGFVPEDFVTTGMAISPASTPTPVWNSALNLVLPDKEDRAALQELFGYAFFPAVSLQVFFFLHGDGGTGKDTVISVLKEMIGEDRVSAVPLCELGKGHANEGLIDSILNVNMEAEKVTEAGELALKMITGDSPIQIDPKFMRTYTKRLPVKFILAANSLPHFHDKSSALWTRYVQIPFNVKVGEALAGKDEKQLRITSLLAKLRPEYDGILLWALAGLKRALATGKIRAAAFSQSQQAIEQIAEHKIGSNSFLGWLDECAELCEMGLSPKPDVYDSYKSWCADSGYKNPLGKHNFGKELKRVGVVVRRGHRPPDWYVGIKLRGVAEAEEGVA